MVPRACYSPGATIHPVRIRPTTLVGKPALSRSDNLSRMPTAYSTCARTCMNGAATGSMPTTMRFHLVAIRKDRKKAREKLRAEVHGGTKSRFHDARHALASRQNSNMLITGFGSFVTELEFEPAHLNSSSLLNRSVPFFNMDWSAWVWDAPDVYGSDLIHSAFPGYLCLNHRGRTIDSEISASPTSRKATCP